MVFRGEELQADDRGQANQEEQAGTAPEIDGDAKTENAGDKASRCDRDGRWDIQQEALATTITPYACSVLSGNIWGLPEPRTVWRSEDFRPPSATLQARFEAQSDASRTEDALMKLISMP